MHWFSWPRSGLPLTLGVRVQRPSKMNWTRWYSCFNAAALYTDWARFLTSLGFFSSQSYSTNMARLSFKPRAITLSELVL